MFSCIFWKLKRFVRRFGAMSYYDVAFTSRQYIQGSLQWMHVCAHGGRHLRNGHWVAGSSRRRGAFCAGRNFNCMTAWQWFLMSWTLKIMAFAELSHSFRALRLIYFLKSLGSTHKTHRQSRPHDPDPSFYFWNERVGSCAIPSLMARLWSSRACCLVSCLLQLACISWHKLGWN